MYMKHKFNKCHEAAFAYTESQQARVLQWVSRNSLIHMSYVNHNIWTVYPSINSHSSQLRIWKIINKTDKIVVSYLFCIQYFTSI